MNKIHYNYIDALRGYAILAVMAVHASQMAPAIGGLRQFLDQGARGVQLFFVASALTLAMSWNIRKDGISSFYIRRFFRIAPMFWLGILFFVWLNGFGPRYFAPNGIGLMHIGLTAIFMHGWHPDTLTSVVPGGWSIAVEMMFYLFFPIIIFFIRDMRCAITGFLISFLVAIAVLAFCWTMRTYIWPSAPDGLISTLLSLWFPNQLPVFMVGFIVYFANQDYQNQLQPWILQLILGCSIAVMFALPLVLNGITIYGRSLEVLSYTLYSIFFGILAFCLAQGAGKWLVNAPVRFIGKVSFSAYLIHFAVLQSEIGLSVIRSLNDSYGVKFFLTYFLFLIFITVGLSSITYRFIEKPMILLGNRLILQHHNSLRT